MNMVKTVAPMNTKEQLLDIAERHFADYGYRGTSLRGIIKEANVNVAAVAYHFGDKEALFSAVIERFAAPVVERQLDRLAAELTKDHLNLDDILRAFYEPPLQIIKKRGKKGMTLSLFLGRIQTEPDPIYSLVDHHFARCRNRFIEAFTRLQPASSAAEHQWNFEFMLSLIVCFLTRQQPIRQRYNDKGSDWDVEAATARLIAFCSHGMQSTGT